MIKQALMDQNALKAIYDDPTLRTSYVDNTNNIKKEEDSIYILKIDPVHWRYLASLDIRSRAFIPD